MPGGATIYDTMPELTPITWSDFDYFGALYDGQKFDSESEPSYTGGSLNNTVFEGDISLPAGSGFRYAVSSSWFGLTFMEKSGALEISTAGAVYINGNTGTAYTLDAEKYDLTTFTNQRFTVKIELYNLADDNLSANVNIYVNKKLVAENITLTGTAGNTTQLGNKLGFANTNAGLPGGATIYKTMPKLTPITWKDFGVTYGTTYTQQSIFGYTGDSLNNTAFEGDIAFSSGAMMRYATVNGYFGLRMGVDAETGKFFLKGAGPAYIDGWDQTLEFEPGTFKLTAFADTRLTLKIVIREMTELSALVSVYINGIQAGSEFNLTADTTNDAYKLGKMVGFCVEESNTSITILKDEPVPTGLTPLSWEEFGYTGGQTYSSPKSQSALHLENLDGTLFDGDVMMTAGSELIYGGTDSWTGIKITANENGTLSMTGYGSTINLSTSTFNPKHYGLTNFAGDKFNLKIAMTDGDFSDANSYKEEVRVWINDQILGDAFTFTAHTANILGTTLHMCTTNDAITPYSNLTTVPTGLTPISFKDWKADVAEGEGYLDDNEISGAHPTVKTFIGTTFNETVKFEGTETEHMTHLFCYGGNGTNSWLGTRIYLSGKNMNIYCVDTGISFTLDPQKAGVGTSFANTEFTWRIDTVALEKNVLLYMSFNGVLYNNAPFVLYNFADTISNTIEYNSYNEGDATTCGNYYVVLGPSEKTLPVLYHDLSEDDYTIPSGITALYQITVENEIEKETQLSIENVTTLSSVGDYKVFYYDGASKYIQRVVLYMPGEVSAVELVRAIKHVQEKEDEAYVLAGVRVCDVDGDGEIQESDVDDIRDMLLGLYEEDTTSVMPISGYWGPSGILVNEDTYKLLKELGINHISKPANDYTDQVMDRYKVYQQFAWAQKYGIDMMVSDGRLLATPSTATQSAVQNAIANYKDYQSFGGLFMVDEPDGATYPATTSEKTIAKYAPLAKAARETNIFTYANLHPFVYPTARKQGRYEYTTYLRDYVKQFNPTVLSYDNYPFTSYGASTGDTGSGVHDAYRYFENLAMAKYVSENENNIPFWAFVQVGDGFQHNEITANNPSKGEFKWLANTALAFGAKGIQYFPLVQPEGFKDIDENTSSNGLLNKKGEKTEWFDYAVDVNAQVAAIDEVLMNATNDGLMSTGGYAKSQATDKVATMELREKVDGWLSSSYELRETINPYTIRSSYNGATVTSSESTYGALTGCFTYGEKHALYIVNYNVEGDSTIKVDFTDDNTKATTIHNAVKSEKTGDIQMTLGAGEAVLVVY